MKKYIFKSTKHVFQIWILAGRKGGCWGVYFPNTNKPFTPEYSIKVFLVVGAFQQTYSLTTEPPPPHLLLIYAKKYFAYEGNSRLPLHYA